MTTLTDAEREAMWQAHAQQGPHFNRLVMTVERLISARLEQQREELAAAIEDARDLSRVGSSPFVDFGGNVGWLDHEWDDAARIVREYQPREDT